MTENLLISELAARSGVPSTTLRYYEQVGLLPPPDRTSSGYRVYDTRSVSRLRFITRAKALGLPLDEIRELVAVWDSDACGHVQDRLRDRIASRREQVELRIEELRLLSAELAEAAARLGTDSPAEPCGDGCGCTVAATDHAQAAPDPAVVVAMVGGRS